MKAFFVMNDKDIPLLVVEPDPDEPTEAMLLAAFIRYEQNVFSVSVERDTDGLIKSAEFSASQS